MRATLLPAIMLLAAPVLAAGTAPAEKTEPARWEGFLLGQSLRGVPLKEALEEFREYEDLEFVLEPGIEETPVTFTFHRVPWRRALDLLLATHGLAGVAEGKVVRVSRAGGAAGPVELLVKGMALVEADIYLGISSTPLSSSPAGSSLPEERMARVDPALLQGGSEVESLRKAFSVPDLRLRAWPRCVGRVGEEMEVPLFVDGRDQEIGLLAEVSHGGPPGSGKLYLDLAFDYLDDPANWFRGGIPAGERVLLGGRIGDPPLYVFVAVTAWIGEKGEEPSSEESRKRDVEGVVPPKLLDGERPKYPRKMYVRGIQGEVTLNILVGVDGLVQDIEALEYDSPEFRDAAIHAIRRWRYAPGTKDGKPVPMWTKLTYSFSLLY